jgi:phosphonate transport system substrate-binding protein
MSNPATKESRMKLSHFGIVALSFALAAPAAADWRSSIKELRFGVIPVETQTQTSQGFDEFAKYAAQKFGVPVKLYTATEYIGINNAIVAKQIEFAWTSPSAYSGSWLECQCVEPIAAALDKDGNLGYNAVLIVKSESPYKRFEDLKGRTVARTEPNSQSGYLVPTVEFSKMGMPVDQFFKSPISGGHTQSVLGVLKGNFDAAFTWTTRGDGYGQLRTMMDKGMLKREQIRVIWESALVPAPPVIVHKELPADLKAEMTQFFLDLHKERMDVAEAVAHGKTAGFVKVGHQDYLSTVESRKMLATLRKK